MQQPQSNWVSATGPVAQAPQSGARGGYGGSYGAPGMQGGGGPLFAPGPGAGQAPSRGAAGGYGGSYGADRNMQDVDSPYSESTVQPAISTTDMPPPPRKFPLTGGFGNGFQLSSEDGEYTMQFHDLTQVDGRFYTRGNQDPVHDTFALPRQWFIFNGNLTKSYEYYVAAAEGFDNLNVLDAFLNVHYWDEFQVKIGRYKTPHTYEFYALPVQGQINPERSLYFNNFGINRDLGVMAHGTVNKAVDYAVGVFNGTRNGYVDHNDGKDVLGYINVRPWENAGIDALQHWNFGGSLAYGDQNNPAVPRTLRTQVATSGVDTVGIPFLSFNNGVLERGQRFLWTLHSAYYYQQLSLVAEWQAGNQHYATSAVAPGVNLPIQSFYVQGGYFLTGETVSFRNVVRPKRPFNIKKGQWGPGAWEMTGRYNYLDIGDQVFTSGLANQAIWTNRIGLIDVGMNWYPTQYLKMMFTWEHANFGSPVQYAPGKLHSSSDMFWTRMQVFF